MPFVIAGLVYGFFAAIVMVTVTVIGLARGRKPNLIMLAGAIGSGAGFLIGCVFAVMALIAGAGGQVGATMVIAPSGLLVGLLGAAGGVFAMRWARSTWGQPNSHPSR